MSDRRYELEPLLTAYGKSWRKFREATRTNTQTLHQAAKNGLTAEQADRLAIRAGLHPIEVWGHAWLS